MSKIQNPFQKEDWIEEMIQQAPEFKQFQKDLFQNFKAIKRLEEKKYEVETRSSFLDIFQVFTTHAVTASLTAMLCLGGVASFAAEKTLPVEFKPSTLVNKINPFAENLKGGRNWNWQSSSSKIIAPVVSSSSAVSSSSVASQSSSSAIVSSSSSTSQSSLTSSSSSIQNISSVVQSSSSNSSAVIAASSKSVTISSTKKEQVVESAKSLSETPKFENTKLKIGEISKDKNTFTMKDGDGNIYSFSNVKGATIDLFDLNNSEQEYVFSGNSSETIIDRIKYPAIKWRIFNVKESSKLEKLK